MLGKNTWKGCDHLATDLIKGKKKGSIFTEQASPYRFLTWVTYTYWHIPAHTCSVNGKSAEKCHDVPLVPVVHVLNMAGRPGWTSWWWHIGSQGSPRTLHFVATRKMSFSTVPCPQEPHGQAQWSASNWHYGASSIGWQDCLCLVSKRL